MSSLFKIAAICLAVYATTGCNKGAKPSIAQVLEGPLEFQGYKLGLSEKAVLKHLEATCQTPPGKLDADRICSASMSISGQPALMFFYFFNDSLEKLALAILPRNGQLSEVSKIFSEEFKTKYGKPSTDSTSTVIWQHSGGLIIINRGDERTMTINVMSDKYEGEKTRRMENAGRGIEI